MAIKIITKGKPESERRYRFKCLDCGSVLEAEIGDLVVDGFYRNERYYIFSCPVCQKDRTICRSDMKEV